jgi:hypothetical protein
MADEPVAPLPAAPEGSVSAPVAEPIPADPSAVEATTTPVDTKSSVDAPKIDSAPETLLSEAPKPADAQKPNSEAPKAEDVTKELSQTDEPAPQVLPSYEAWKLPDGAEPLKSELLSGFGNELGEFELSHKVDHAAMQQFGQKLVDRANQVISETQTKVINDLAGQFEAKKNEWKNEIVADEEFGGKRLQTTIDRANRAIRTLAGPDEPAFRALMKDYGVGNNPVLIRMLARAGEMMREAKPLVAQSPVSAEKLSVIDKMYGKHK